MARFKMINGVRVQLTAEEETIRDAEEAAWEIKKQNMIDEQTASDEKKASGKAKLKAGEALTNDELSALFGD